MPRIGIIGCGNIAGLIAAHGEDYAEIAACFDIDPPRMQAFGLDNLKVARVAPLDRLVLRTTKHPRALGLSPEESRRCLFRGPATEAVRQFPKNINVSAAIGLATRDIAILAASGTMVNTAAILAHARAYKVRTASP